MTTQLGGWRENFFLVFRPTSQLLSLQYSGTELQFQSRQPKLRERVKYSKLTLRILCVRTTSKLEVASGDSEGSPEPRCPLCSGRNSDIVDSPSVEATQISRVMSSIAHFNKDGMAIDLSTDAIRNGNCLKGNQSRIVADHLSSFIFIHSTVFVFNRKPVWNRHRTKFEHSPQGLLQLSLNFGPDEVYTKFNNAFRLSS